MLALFTILWAWLSVAAAQPVDVTFCADYCVSYGDDGTLDFTVPSRAYSKYTIAHEIGHALQIERDEDGFPGTGSPDTEYDLTPGNCYTNLRAGDLWEQNSLEYQSTAAVEGFADFYAALIFNRNQVDDDCFYATRNVMDWNLDGTFPTSFENHFPSCDQGPYPVGVAPPIPIPSFDYLGNYCLGGGSGWNRATVYDYTRFLWDLNTGSQGCSGAVHFDEILSVWDVADPKDWNPEDTGLTGDFPAERLIWAAGIVGVDTEWDFCDHIHGVHR